MLVSEVGWGDCIGGWGIKKYSKLWHSIWKLLYKTDSENGGISYVWKASKMFSTPVWVYAPSAS